jgi:hypothetical protein
MPFMLKTPTIVSKKPSKLAKRLRFTSPRLANSTIESKHLSGFALLISSIQAITFSSKSAVEGEEFEEVQRLIRRRRVRLGTKSLEERTCMVAGQVS